MNTVIATYLTRSGKTAYAIKRRECLGRVTYDYNGAYGAGSGHSLETMQRFHRITMQSKRGMKLGSGADILTIQP
jgi:hypothetical protein